MHAPKHTSALNADSDYFSWLATPAQIFQNTHKDNPAAPQIPDFAANEYRRGYYASVTDVDVQVGHLLDELTLLDLEHKTMVVLTADHGFALGENNMWGKSTTYEAAARVPLLIKVPWLHSSAGRRVHSAVESVGLYSTLVSLAELPTGEALSQLQGDSFAHLLKSESSHDIAQSVAFVESPRQAPAKSAEFGVRTARWCYNEFYQVHHSGPRGSKSPATLYKEFLPSLDELVGIELLDCSDKYVSVDGFETNLALDHPDDYNSEIDHLAHLLRTNFQELPPFSLASLRNQTRLLWTNQGRSRESQDPDLTVSA